MPEAQTREMPMLDVRAAAKPESYDAEKRTAIFVASTGARGLRRRFWGEDYYEELEVSESAVRMGRLNNGAPFLNSHNSWDTDDVLGVVERAWIEGNELLVEVRFSQRAAVEPILQDIADGILRHVSIGYMIHEYNITEKSGELDVYRAVDWEPMEVSIVPMGFDDAAVARNAQKMTSQAKMTHRALGPKTEKEGDMPTEKRQEEQAPDKPEAKNPTAEEQQREADDQQRAADDAARTARDEATKAERKRVSDIQSAVRAAKLGAEFADELIREGVTMDIARQRIIDKWVAQDDSEEIRGIRTGFDSEIQNNVRDGIANALMVRAGVESDLSDHGRNFAHRSLMEICRDLLERGGVSTAGMPRHQVAARALSTSDLVYITGALTNRTLLQGYESGRRTFVNVFRRTENADFRDINRVRLSGAPSLEEVKENGEFKYGKLTDEKETYALATYGKILPFTRQSIMNDDLSALTRLPMAFGRAAADLESDLVWKVFLDNDPLQDGTALFHANHSNLAGSGAAPSESTLAAAEQAMMEQIGIESRPINVMPAFLIVPPQHKVAAQKLLTAIDPTKTGDVNVYANSMDLVVEARLKSSAAWYLAADYNQVDTIEYCYLEGNQGVYIETREGFNVDGIEIKARHDFAAKAIDYRGLYKNPGA